MHCSNPSLPVTSRQILPNFRQQLARGVGFRHTVVTAGRASSLFLAAKRIGGDRDDWDRFQGGIGFDAARGGIAVHDWQLDIHQDEIGPLLRDCFERLLTVFGLGDFVIGAGKHIANDLAIILLVFDHQNALAHAASTCRSTRYRLRFYPVIESRFHWLHCTLTKKARMALGLSRQWHQLMSSERSSEPTSRVFSNWLEQLVSRRFATPSFIPPCLFVNYLTSITINHSHALRTFILEMVCHAVVDHLFDKCALGKMKF